VTIANNRTIPMATERGITLTPGQRQAFLQVKIEGNNLRNNLTGVNIQGFVGAGRLEASTWAVAHRSKAPNDFRGFTALVNNYELSAHRAIPPTAPSRQENFFSVPDP